MKFNFKPLTAAGWNRRREAEQSGLTLLEVMIASGILFLCLFAILSLLANTLRNARALQRTPVDAGMLAAELSLTNRLTEGSDSGDFGDAYPDYQWRSETYEVSSNGLFAVDYAVYRRSGGKEPESRLSILLFRPDSQKTLGGGGPRR